ncbi:MAG TPA: TPM domain-containing protein [Planctomycetota bacterium]|nr:TPM domain-containing protein [Planctomycetota bacterium]
MVASKLFRAEDRKAISAAVAEAEKKTSAEIVPVIATTSDRYERAEDLVGLGAAMTAVAATWTQFQRLPTDWEGDAEIVLHLPYVLAIFAAGWALGVLLAKSLPWLKRLAISRKTSLARVLIAAHHAFESLHVDTTAGSTGVVLYVSLFERRVCVWADRGISEKIPEAEWKEACETLTRGLKDGKAREGFVDAIRKLGDVLAKHFPARSTAVNELSNELRILD